MSERVKEKSKEVLRKGLSTSALALIRARPTSPEAFADQPLPTVAVAESDTAPLEEAAAPIFFTVLFPPTALEGRRRRRRFLSAFIVARLWFTFYTASPIRGSGAALEVEAERRLGAVFVAQREADASGS